MKQFQDYIKGISPTALLIQGYLFYMIVGWALLSLPLSQVDAIGALDNLFIAASAVSTTGLVTVDPGSSYTFFGQLVILGLIQLGGIGYMTFGSFILLSLRHKAFRKSLKVSEKAFALPEDFKIAHFIKRVIVFTFICEAIGAAVLFAFFYQDGLDNALWIAIFHSISAFCTAGFSLFSNSFESYADHTGINVIISALSILGAIGFIVMVDVWEKIRGQRDYLHFTSKIIVRTTLLFLVIGTLVLTIIEPSIQNLDPATRVQAAFFQVMTATTTVGFNTIPIGELTSAAILLLYFFMLFGASPSGTGGGLKSTTFAALGGLVKSTLKGRDKIRLSKRILPLDKLQLATASFTYYFLVLAVASFVLLLVESAPLEIVLFEVFSALGTVGLSMGLTGELSDLGKLVIIILMFMGRVGILTFGIAMSMHDESKIEEGDNDLVL
uniref:TrkH family potassium uptake protein n=1 Tax=Ningiella ruwaisensis TaxID=2364274 RepID=UPI001F4F89E6|nr:potassium transporter TrkG [Ningiella ruwaisensis]